MFTQIRKVLYQGIYTIFQSVPWQLVVE